MFKKSRVESNRSECVTNDEQMKTREKIKEIYSRIPYSPINSDLYEQLLATRTDLDFLNNHIIGLSEPTDLSKNLESLIYFRKLSSQCKIFMSHRKKNSIFY